MCHPETESVTGNWGNSYSYPRGCSKKNENNRIWGKAETPTSTNHFSYKIASKVLGYSHFV